MWLFPLLFLPLPVCEPRAHCWALTELCYCSVTAFHFCPPQLQQQSLLQIENRKREMPVVNLKPGNTRMCCLKLQSSHQWQACDMWPGHVKKGFVATIELKFRSVQLQRASNHHLWMAQLQKPRWEAGMAVSGYGVPCLGLLFVSEVASPRRKEMMLSSFLLLPWGQ